MTADSAALSWPDRKKEPIAVSAPHPTSSRLARFPPTTRGIWSTALTTDRKDRRRHAGHCIETWARLTRHSDGITRFLSKLKTEARADSSSALLWSVPTARSDRAYSWGQSAIAPDAVGKLVVDGLEVPFYLEYELRARHPKGVVARLRPYTRYYWSTEPGTDQPPFPVTLFVVDGEGVEAAYVSTADRMSVMSLPILVSCRPVLSSAGILGRSGRPLWEPGTRCPWFSVRASGRCPVGAPDQDGSPRGEHHGGKAS